MYDESEGRGLGGAFWARVLGMAVGAVLVGAVLWFLFGWAWGAWGLIGAFLVFGLVLFGFSYIYDRRHGNRPSDWAN
jgi:hypothetical protein